MSQRYVLKVLVLVGGMSSLGVEMAASRLLAPFFGTSLLVWANLIGLILVYLALGYWLGGRLADRRPEAGVLYGLVAVAGVLIGLIPFIARPILQASVQSFFEASVSLFAGSLLATLALFSLPVILLGMISPFAVRLSLHDLQTAGRDVGALYALSTLGSIAGVFLPVLLLIPLMGTRRTFLAFALALLGIAMLGLYRDGRRRASLAALAGVGALLALEWLTPRLVRPLPGLLYENESPYHFVQVFETGSDRWLALNEGQALHSWYNPDNILSGGIWDTFALGPLFAPGGSDLTPLPPSLRGKGESAPPPLVGEGSHLTPLPPSLRGKGESAPPPLVGEGAGERSATPPLVGEGTGERSTAPRSLALIGLAAGTVARQYTAIYGPVDIVGVEIDPLLVDVGERFFDMRLPNLRPVVGDGRTWLQTETGQFDVIALDAYRQPYIPFHLTTVEFFSLARERLTDNGVLVINVGHSDTDYRLVDALAATLRQVFPSVYVISPDVAYNSLLVATRQPSTMTDYGNNVARATNPLLLEVIRSVVGRVRPWQGTGIVLTDDLAPVELITDQIIVRYVLTGK